MAKQRRAFTAHARTASVEGTTVPPQPAQCATTTGMSGLLDYVGSVAAGLFVLQLGCFVATLHPSVPGGDSGELISVAHVGGVPHPPGYPLFSVANMLFAGIVPIGSIAYRANLLSAICAAGAGTLLYSTTVLLSGCVSSGVLAVALFSFSRLQWLYSITGEVFALNNLLVAALLHQLVLFDRAPTVSLAWRGAVLAGLALANQHTAVLYLVVIVPWVLLRGRSIGLLTPRSIAVLILCGVAGLAPYLYIPWSSLRNTAPLTWGDQRSLSGFATHLLRKEYGTFDLAKGGRETASFWRAVEAHATSLARETMQICPVLSVVGAVVPPRPCRWGVHMAIVACLVVYLGFFNWRANLDLTNRLLAGVQERFWMQPNLVFSLFAGLGYRRLLVSARRVAPSRTVEVVGFAVVVAVLAVQIGRNFEKLDESNNHVVHDFGRTLLDGLPPDSILLTMGDLPGNAARYLQNCDGVRPDVRVIDLEMMTTPWYLPMTSWAFPGVVFPGQIKRYSFGAEHFDMKMFFDANIVRRPCGVPLCKPCYLCEDTFDIFVYENLNAEDGSWRDGYEVWRHGATRAIKRKGTRLNATAWLASALPATPNHTLPDPAKHDERTWEHVVYDSAMASAVHLAMFFESRAGSAATVAEKAQLYEAAATVYESLYTRTVFDGHRPSFWHKNAGLAYYNTQNAAHSTKVKEHWQAYLDSNPDDPQVSDIASIVKGIS